MKKISYEENISKDSLWNTATPSQTALKMPLYGIEAGHFYAEKDYTVKRDFHDSYLVLYTVKGKGIVNGNEISEHEATVIDCTKPHSYGSLSENWEFLWLHFGGNFSKDIFEIALKDISTPIKVPKDFEAILTDIVGTFFIQSIVSLLHTSESIQKLISLMAGAEPLISKENLDSALEYIQAHISEQISIDDISSYVNLSRYHFIRVFKHSIGITPYAYIINCRITLAKRLLMETSFSVDEIAHECGFLDTANFIAKFKKHTGMSPLKYRNSSLFQ